MIQIDRILKITVGIPAYNEEQNIRQLLENIMSQKLKSGVLDEILVVADGCTDSTAYVAQSISDSRIRVLEHTVRRGLPATQNEITAKARGDALVILNGDVLLAHDRVLEAMVSPFLTDNTLGIVGARIVSAPPHGFFERVIETSHRMKSWLYMTINGGNNMYMCPGRARAFSRDFYTRITWPRVYSEDVYSYLSCMSLGFTFRLATAAEVIFRSPSTLRDHLLQSLRFLSGKKLMVTYFPKKDVLRAYHIPVPPLAYSVIRSMVWRPLETLVYLFVIGYSFGINLLRPEEHRVFFQQSVTSKKLV